MRPPPQRNDKSIYHRHLSCERGTPRDVIAALRQAVAAYQQERQSEIDAAAAIDDWFTERPELHRRCLAFQRWRNQQYSDLQEYVDRSQRASMAVDLRDAQHYAMLARSIGYREVVVLLDAGIKRAWKQMSEPTLVAALDLADEWRARGPAEKNSVLNVLVGDTSPVREAFALFAAHPRGAMAIESLESMGVFG